MRVLLIHYSDGLTKLFKEIKEKETIDELSIEYKKFAEWLRIESVPKTPFSVSCLLLVELLQLSIIFSSLKTILRIYLRKQSVYTP